MSENKTTSLINSETNNSLISEKTATNISSIPDVEISNLEPIKSDVTTIEKHKTEDKALRKNPADETTQMDVDSDKKFSLSTDGNCNLKEPSADIKTLSPSSEGSLSKYITPIGSTGDLTMQVDKSLNCSIDKNKNEDSGVDSQSLSISNSINVTQVSSNCDLNNSSMSSESNSKRSNTSKVTNEGISNQRFRLVFVYMFF